MVEMRVFRASKIAILIAAASWIAIGQEQPAKDAKTSEAKGMPPRVAATDYQAQGKAGDVTIGADFTGHVVPVEEGSPLASEDYVVVEVAFFGAPGARLTLSADQFSLRANGKKSPLPSQPFELVLKSLKDPEWEPPGGDPKSKSKSSMSTGGAGGGGGGRGGNKEMDNGPPPVVHMPIELRRAMELKVRRVSLPPGERLLPQAGLIFFSYHGKATGISSLELIYEGPAGKATLNLQP
jgi:hypothetical protein